MVSYYSDKHGVLWGHRERALREVMLEKMRLRPSVKGELSEKQRERYSRKRNSLGKGPYH